MQCKVVYFFKKNFGTILFRLEKRFLTSLRSVGNIMAKPFFHFVKKLRFFSSSSLGKSQTSLALRLLIVSFRFTSLKSQVCYNHVTNCEA